MTAERKKSGIYTRTGDGGMTSLGDGQRVRKTDKRMCALGAIDELNSFIGLVLSSTNWEDFRGDHRCLDNIQEDLFSIGAELSGAETSRIESERIALIEEKIDAITAELKELKNFILPGGTIKSAWLHVCRSVCRRAERIVVRISQREHINPDIVVYMNRLSDLFFVLARKHNNFGVGDILWKP